MSKFILQATFDSQYQDLILKTENYCVRYSDRDNDFSNRELIKTLFFDFQNEQLRVKTPRTRREEIARKVAVLTLDYYTGGLASFLDDDEFEEVSINQLYARYITTALPADKELHLLIYLNLEKKEDIKSIQKLLSIFPPNLAVTLDVMLLPVDSATDDLDTIKNNLLSLVDLKQENNDKFGNIFYWENIDSHGAAHELTTHDLVATYGRIVLALINGYDNIVNYHNDYPITTFSLNSLQIDKFKIIEGWCHEFLRNLIKPLVSCDQTESIIDKNKVHNILRQILEQERQQLSNLRDNGEKAPNVSDNLKSKIFEIILQNNLNLREREYMLDCFRSLMDRTSESELLDSDGVPIPDELFADMLGDLTGNDLYVKLRDVIRKIRDLKKSISLQEQQIEEIKNHLDDYSYDGELTDNGFSIHGQEFHTYSFNETPLESDFQPQSLNLPSSADLRRYFTAIKNQGKQGACASFSLVSVFEFFMANETSTSPNLSEAFVYYNAREKSGDTDKDSGTTLHNVIKAMTDSGICIEELCPYKEKVFDEKPNDEAYIDGQKRKVVNAQNVQLEIETVKAAINEGYPVVASFRVFDSLAKNVGGFVSLPSPKERENEKKEYHAMVICGYSDEQGYFIVRNSWGKDFGDKGYCYIPYAYVRDSELTTYACAITGIDIATAQHKADQFLYNKQDQNNNIQYSILQNLLVEDQYRLNNDRQTLKKLSAQYAVLIHSIVKGDCLNDIKVQLDKEVADRESKIQQLWDEQSCFRISNQKIPNIAHAALSVISLATLLYGIFSDTIQPTIIGGSVVLLLCVLSFFIRLAVSKKKVSAIQTQINALENEIVQLQQNYQKKVKLQKHIAQLIGDVEAVSDNSKKRKDLLLEIERILSESYKWLSDNLPDQREPLLFPDEYQQIITELKGKIKILPSLFVDEFNFDKIMDAFHTLQTNIFQYFSEAFDIIIEDIYGLETDEWRRFNLQNSNLPLHAQVTLTQDEPGVTLFFSNIKKDNVLNNYFPVFVNNNQYLYIHIKRITIEKNLKF